MKNIIIQWQLPTVRQLGGPLPIEEILHAEIELSADGGASYSPISTFPPATLEVPVNDLPFGSQYIARGRCQDTRNVNGNWKEAPFVLSDESPPGDLVVTIAIQ